MVHLPKTEFIRSSKNLLKSEVEKDMAQVSVVLALVLPDKSTLMELKIFSNSDFVALEDAMLTGFFQGNKQTRWI
jgi:hypothetical protein